MAWYSVLPAHLTTYETWIIRTFVILAIVNLAPWLSLILYDLLLYIFRAAYHEIPLYGGRARGGVRPRAPSLADRNRRMSFAELITGVNPRNANAAGGGSSHTRLRSVHAVEGDDLDEEEEVVKR